MPHRRTVTAEFARDIIGLVGTARSAVRALRESEDGRISVLTTACIGASFLPSSTPDRRRSSGGRRRRPGPPDWG